MPVSSALYPTSTVRKQSYLPPSLSTYKKASTYSSSYYTSNPRSSLIGSYRLSGDDSTSPSRFGVSRYSTTSSSILSSSSRTSTERDYRKPPIGSRFRSESCSRDKPLELSSKCDLSSTNQFKRQSSSSLASSVATSGADFYAKYSPATYKPNCELSRSRSLSESTGNKLVDSINSSSRSASRASSKDRGSSYSSTTKDYLNNTTTNNTTTTTPSSIIKVNANATYSPLSGSSFATKQCCLVANNNNNALSEPVVVPTPLTNNNNFHHQHNNKKPPPPTTSTLVKQSVVGRALLANNQTASASIGGHHGKPVKVTTITFDTTNVHRTAVTPTPPPLPLTTNKVFNNSNNNNNCTPNETAKANSNTLKTRLGTYPLAPYKNSNFLKCEYDLARSQVVKSTSLVPASNNNPSKSDNNNTFAAANNDKHIPEKLTIYGQNSLFERAKNKTTFQDTKINSKTTSEANQSNAPNMNCIQNNTELFDDIKFIDCDESERKNSPTTANTTSSFSSAKDFFKEYTDQSSTLPSAMLKRTTDVHTNKYSTMTNYMKTYHQMNKIANGTPKRASSEDLMSSASSSSSTLSATPSSASSSMHQDRVDKVDKVDKIDKIDKIKTNGTTKADSQQVDESVDNRHSLTGSSSLWDRDSKVSSASSRTLSDSDAFNKSLASSSISDRSDDSDGLCGLRNIGNTCFMNSVIQCLSHTSELTRYLRTKIDISTSTKDQRIVSEFAKLIKEMWTAGNRSVTPSELKSAVSCKHRMYSGCAQQDAQEFLRFFLDSLHCALNTGTTGQKFEIDDNQTNNKKADLTWEWYSKVENSIIKDLFVGQLKSSLKCTVCGNTSVTFDPFWDLSVPLPSPSTSRCKLENCLDLFIKEEILDGDEMPTCSKCKTRRKCTKSFTIQRFPKYLVIHLKRFSETRWSKLSNVIEFPTNERGLNMAPYAANASSGAQYTLYGISNHMGSTAGGHYVAVCKHPTTRKWHEFNDNAVTSASESSLVSSSAYLLFYERM